MVVVMFPPSKCCISAKRTLVQTRIPSSVAPVVPWTQPRCWQCSLQQIVRVASGQVDPGGEQKKAMVYRHYADAVTSLQLQQSWPREDRLFYVMFAEPPKARTPWQAQFKSRKVRKDAVWKQWRPEVVCKAAFANRRTQQVRRQAHAKDATGTWRRAFIFVVAPAIKSQERREQHRITLHSKRRGRPIPFLTSKNMHDEHQILRKRIREGQNTSASLRCVWPSNLGR